MDDLMLVRELREIIPRCMVRVGFKASFIDTDDLMRLERLVKAKARREMSSSQKKD